MKIHKISYAIGSVGIFTIFIYTWKFFIRSDFTSMWMLGSLFGATLLAGAYLYSWMKNIDDNIDKLSLRIDSFGNWFFKNVELPGSK